MGITFTESIKRFALDEAGFDLVGVSSVTLPPQYGAAYRRWLNDAFQGTMDYMARDPERRIDPRLSLPGARSVISLALNYYRSRDPRSETPSGKVSKYAYGADYHKIIEKKLKRLARHIREDLGGRAKTYVDTGPILERAFAEQAGLGFIGKNANLITREFGSWVFLASVITDLDLEADVPAALSCGTCRICIDACPTQAIVGEGRIDARRCISYQTIESREAIPTELGEKMGEWIFGCDICQDVCPHNSRARETKEPGFMNPIAGSFLPLQIVEAVQSDEAFSERFRGSPVKRTKRSGLQRNARAIAGASLVRPADWTGARGGDAWARNCTSKRPAEGQAPSNQLWAGSRPEPTAGSNPIQ